MLEVELGTNHPLIKQSWLQKCEQETKPFGGSAVGLSQTLVHQG